jgi:phosphotriesterase-related protein
MLPEKPQFKTLTNATTRIGFPRINIMKSVFIFFAALLLLSPGDRKQATGMIMTVNGFISPADMGVSLIHEHILVDFIGADKIHPQRWQHDKVIPVALPYLQELKKLGGKTFIECTPAYLGRDPLLLKKLADATGLHILTNTGYYGAGNNKYLPAHAFTETADQLAQRWIQEWEKGINGTGIKPGFIKIGVNEGPLSGLHRKLVTAAARTHLKTGLKIASHTGQAPAAWEQLSLLEKEGVSPQAFIWVHAQGEKDLSQLVKAAQKGAWISLDGLSDDNLETYLQKLTHLKAAHLLNKTLLSHDAGWYRPGEAKGGDYRGYTPLLAKFLPRLRQQQFSEAEIRQLLVSNPAQAFAVQVYRKE